MEPNLLIFEDDAGALGPLTDLRAVFELRTGAATTLARIERALNMQAAALAVRPHLAQAVAARRGAAVNQPLTDAPWRVVNGRWPGAAHVETVTALRGGEVLTTESGALVAAACDGAQARRLIQCRFRQWPQMQPVGTRLPDAALIHRPWHILDALERTLASDLAACALPVLDPAAAAVRGVSLFGRHDCRAADNAVIRPQVVVNTEQGDVVIGEDVRIEPFAAIAGPCFIGRGSVVNAHANIRPNTVIGPGCKVGGEVSFSILQGYSNKAHDGFLGHSLVGQWVNLGGGTNVSNLKNTYGPIRVQLERDDEPEDTGRTFLGPIIGDFTLTAIGTRILTGSVIGTGTMLALSGFSPKRSEPFSFHTDARADRYDLDRFLDMAQRMTARRCCGLRPEDQQLIRDLHARTAPAQERLRLHG